MRSLKCRHKDILLPPRPSFRGLRDEQPWVPAAGLADVEEAVGQGVCFQQTGCVPPLSYLPIWFLVSVFNLHIYLLYVCIF